MRLGVVDDVQSTLPTVAPPQRLERTGGVRVKGVGDLLVRFAKCCHPIPGDPIIGFITRGKGVTVHLQSCPTVLNEREVSRLIDVEWEAAPTETYPIAIRVEAYDRTGLLSDITQVVAENKVNIVAAHVGVTPDHTAVVTATIQVALGLAAGPGHGPDRDAQGRHSRPARPRLTRIARRAPRRGTPAVPRGGSCWILVSSAPGCLCPGRSGVGDGSCGSEPRVAERGARREHRFTRHERRCVIASIGSSTVDPFAAACTALRSIHVDHAPDRRAQPDRGSGPTAGAKRLATATRLVTVADRETLAGTRLRELR